MLYSLLHLGNIGLTVLFVLFQVFSQNKRRKIIFKIGLEKNSRIVKVVKVL